MKLRFALTLAITFLTLILTACGDPDNNPDTSPAKKPGGGGGGAGGGQGQVFDGVLQVFNAEYVSPLSGRLRPGEYLAYKFEIWADTLGKGSIQLFECQNASCELRAIKYKLNCNFDFLTCQILDGNGQQVKRGGLYQADASEVGDLQIEGSCSRFTGGRYKQCAFITLIDPMLKRPGFNQTYLAADFLPEKGQRTPIKRFHVRN